MLFSKWRWGNAIDPGCCCIAFPSLLWDIRLAWFHFYFFHLIQLFWSRHKNCHFFFVDFCLACVCLLSLTACFLSARKFCFNYEVNTTWPGCTKAVIKWLIYYLLSADNALELVWGTGKRQVPVLGHRERIFIHMLPLEGSSERSSAPKQVLAY